MNYLDLPVYRHKDLILNALEHNQAVVVESPTGSGKTTQLPLILHEAGFSRRGIIGITQPRRIAAVSVCGYIARQTGTDIPALAGYKMRFEDRTSPATKIKIMTDGILLQEMKLDPWLSRYSLLVVDEAHERSLNIDFILGLLKRTLESRKDFRVIISSATINAGVFSEYLGECPVVKIEAPVYPVTLIYDPVPAAGPGRNSPEAIIEKTESIVERFISEKRGGDILVFLPGEKMIKDCMNSLASGPAGRYLYILPLYGRLGREEQERVFAPPPAGKTKAVIATNIAETSVTIDGITCVIDSGLSKLNWYNPRTFTSSLVEAPISKASANQRRGRAGRTRAGTCYRLYTRRDFENRSLFTAEEIFRTDLSEVVLRMADLGITNFEEFDFISPPGREGIIAAMETLNLLDALEDDRSLSRTGKLMTEFPLPPRQSRIIVEALLRCPDVTEETIIAAAFLSTQSPYVLPPGEELEARKAHHNFRDPGGDFVSFLRLFRACRDSANREKFCEKNYLDERAMAEIINVAAQLEEITGSLGIPIGHGGSVEDYLYCVARGLIQFVCVRESGGRAERHSYRSLTADRITIHPGSVMFRHGREESSGPRYIVAGEIVRTTRMYAMSVSPLSPEILERLDPKFLSAFDVKRDGRETEEGKKRNRRGFTGGIRICGEIFEITAVKGKKQVRLPWERLSRVKDDAGKEAALQSGRNGMYRGLRGVVVTDGGYTILEGERLSLILSLAPSLEIEGALGRTWPRKDKFNSTDNPGALVEHLADLLFPALWKKGKNDLGFIALFSDGEGNYWFRCSRSFHTAINESLASLEALIDELGEDIDVEKKHIVNQAYRRLSGYLE
ncbi:MAG: ATP-dependent RNA helicase [Treponema sp.]|jgi:HrpA-like RNA helicase|nr:ATP-dependent RNA helicase [Treponema sp.]